MKYAIITCTNGNFAIHSEGYTNISNAKVAFHQYCAALWNDPSTQKATIIIADEQLNAVDNNCREVINRLVEESSQTENTGDD